MRRTCAILFLSTLIGLTLPLKAQEYSFIQYSLQQGLPQSQVYNIEEDRKGFIWIGTNGGGLSRFDGREFENFTKTDGLPSNYIESIFEGEPGELWIGTSKGMAFFDGHTFKVLNKQPFEEPIFDIEKDLMEDQLLLGTSNGLYLFHHQDSSITRLNIPFNTPQTPVNRLVTFEDLTYVATANGVWAYGSIPYDLFNINKLKPKNIIDLLIDHQNRLWALSNKEIYTFELENGSLEQFIPLEFTEKATCLYQTRTGNIWVGTQDKGVGLFNRDSTTWHLLDEQKGLINKHIRTIIHDSWGNQWMGTSGSGLLKNLGQSFIHYKDRLGPGNHRIYALHQKNNEKVWFSDAEKGVYWHDSLGFHPFKRDSGYLKVKCKALFEDDSNRLWVGTEGKGIAIFDSTRMRTITRAQKLPSNWIGNIVQKGNIFWVSTYADGICQLWLLDSTRVRVRHLNRYYRKLPYEINQLIEDPEGNIWFSSKDGRIGFFDQKGRLKLMDQQQGLPGSEILSLHFDSLGQILVGTAGDGLYSSGLEDLSFAPIELPTPLSSSNIYLMVSDENGHLWVGTEKGVDQLIRNKAGVVEKVIAYGQEEGFQGIETCRNAALTDWEGNLWFGTMNGLTKHQPNNVDIKKVPPKLHFKNIYVNNQLIDTLIGTQTPLQLKYHENKLGFGFKGIDFYDPTLLKYRWRLMEVDTQWSKFSKTDNIFFPKLAPGNYNFEVEACSGNTRCSESLNLSFKIAPPFWETNWFKFSVVGFLSLFLSSSVFGYVRRVKRKEAKKRAKLELENSLLLLEQKALQLQMNPHFIF